MVGSYAPVDLLVVVGQRRVHALAVADVSGVLDMGPWIVWQPFEKSFVDLLGGSTGRLPEFREIAPRQKIPRRGIWWGW